MLCCFFGEWTTKFRLLSSTLIGKVMSFRTQHTLRVVFASKYQVSFLRDKNFSCYISPVPPPSSSSHICKLPIESNSSLSYFLGGRWLLYGLSV